MKLGRAETKERQRKVANFYYSLATLGLLSVCFGKLSTYCTGQKTTIPQNLAKLEEIRPEKTQTKLICLNNQPLIREFCCCRPYDCVDKAFI